MKLTRLLCCAAAVLGAVPLALVPAAPVAAAAGDGGVLAWGGDSFAQVGDGGADADRLLPVPVSGLGAGSDVVAAGAGASHSVSLRSDGSLQSWGGDYLGQLGDGPEIADQGTPVAVRYLGPGSGTVAVSAGGYHNLALGSDGSVVAWGNDIFGQLGDGPSAPQFKPVPVTPSRSSTATSRSQASWPPEGRPCRPR